MSARSSPPLPCLMPHTPTLCMSARCSAPLPCLTPPTPLCAPQVRHPNVATHIARDFRILKPLVAAVSRLRFLRGLSLKESVSQFSTTMTAQVRQAAGCV